MVSESIHDSFGHFIGSPAIRFLIGPSAFHIRASSPMLLRPFDPSRRFSSSPRPAIVLPRRDSPYLNSISTVTVSSLAIGII
ncbi:hypothetical protein L195_g010881 [Trifolium pratense]|uniref:Uncharacterized protein n=1 Tax=Trifolium pratense TaxID=57577 RepID=A0A2K3PFY5_TRIPR|nr:hypothetical protein L195_g010881 [Trifolium pratense]